MSRRKKSPTVQSSTTRSFRECDGSWYERNGIREILEAEAVLGEPLDRQEARHGSKGQDELLVCDLARPCERLGGDDAPCLVQ